jgi:hypothetical protein
MDLSFLRPLYEAPEPFASVYLDASRDTEDAGHATALRWRAAREQLADDGADDDTLAALDRAVADHRPHPGKYGLVLFAAGGRVRHTEVLAEPPRREIAAYGPLPHTMPLVVQRGERVPWVRVVVDRTGADLLGMTAGGVPRRGQVTGSQQFPIRKVAPGGWSQPRYQRAAETSWDRNAAEVAAVVAELAEQTGAEVLVVAGDVHARPLLVEHLPDRWLPRVVETDEGSRAAGADPQPLNEATAQAVLDRVRAHLDEVVDRFRTQRGRDGAAGSGLGAVVAALQRSQVDTLLLADDPSSTAELWIGRGPLELSLDPAQLRDLGVEQPQRARADAALVRALVATDARLVVVSPDEVELDGGVGALLRYADAGTRQR